MALNSILAVIHILTAVGGLGLIMALQLMVRTPAQANAALAQQYLKWIGMSLILMLLTGVGMLWATGWLYEHTWWFRIGFLFYVALSAFHGIAQGTMKKIVASGEPLATSPLFGKLRTMTMLMSLALVLIIILMEGKPF